jgi:cell division protein FtsA
MAGVRLESRVHIVTGAVSAAQNIVTCVRRCGLEVNDIILEQLASSHAVLTEDEKNLGVCLIDIGGGTTDIAVFCDGAIQFSAVIPIAGDQVTNDIAMALRTPTQAAESIKIGHACALPELANANDMIDVACVSDRPERKISAKTIADVVCARFEELFLLVRNELRRSGFEDKMAAGIVLTGGSSNVRGVIELAEQVFEMPVRKGCAHSVSGLTESTENPSLSTGVGLLLHGFQQQFDGGFNVPKSSDNAKGMWLRMKEWVAGNF